MKQTILILISGILLILAGCAKEAEEKVEKPVPVKIYKIKAEPISNYIRATGTITAEEDVIVYGKVSERIEKIYVEPGERVNKDQIIAKQKNDILNRGLEFANAALKAAEAQASLAAQNFERMDKLFAEKAVSQQQYDQAKTTKETAEHSFDQAKSAYAQAKEQYENSFVKAPFNGIVAAVYVEENQMINAGQPVVQVLSNSNMKSKLKLTGSDIHIVKAGQNVLIKFPVIPGKVFAGKVERINSAIDQMSKSLEAEITILSDNNKIKSGMFGEFYIETQNHPNSVVVPENALLPQTEVKINRDTGLQTPVKKYFIFVVKNGSARLSEVTTGITNNGQVEINSGLTIGDSVVIVGQNIVKEGQTVNVID